ncbi:MAG: hypothetical protein Q9209_005858 [Squamulea sp. 1 TL-2023]
MLTIWKENGQRENDFTPDEETMHDGLQGREFHDQCNVVIAGGYTPEQNDSLRVSLTEEYEQRKEELNLRYGGRKLKLEIVLKALIAPYLGLCTPKELIDAGDKSTGMCESDRMFDKLWNNTMTRGKIAYLMCKELGRGAGALPVMSMDILKNLGVVILARVLPVIARNLL